MAFIGCALLIFGKNLEIKMLNTPSITIGGKKLKVGDKFDENSNISWSSDKQAMKVLSEDNKLYVLTPKLFTKYNISNFSDYITSVKPTFVRYDGENFPISLEDHKRIFEQDYVLLDSLLVKVGWKVDEDSYFIIKNKKDNKKGSLKIPYDAGFLILKREFFSDSLDEDMELELSVEYIETQYNDSTLITDKMVLHILPVYIDF